MNKRKISWLMAAIAVPALVFGAMASLAFAEDGLDPSRADELAHIALLDESVLEGGNWTTTADDFKSADIPKTTACNNSFAKLQSLEKGIEGQRAGRAKNYMEQTPATGEAPNSVESEVTVYKTSAPVTAVLKDLKTIYALPDMTTCLVNQLDGILSGITGQTVKPYIAADASDPAAAYAGEFKASQLISPIRVEHYAFIQGNTLTQVTFVGPKPAVSEATVKFLMDIQVQSISLISGY